MPEEKVLCKLLINLTDLPVLFHFLCLFGTVAVVRDVAPVLSSTYSAVRRKKDSISLIHSIRFDRSVGPIHLYVPWPTWHNTIPRSTRQKYRNNETYPAHICLRNVSFEVVRSTIHPTVFCVSMEGGGFGILCPLDSRKMRKRSVHRSCFVTNLKQWTQNSMV